jgi:hypothetical protein
MAQLRSIPQTEWKAFFDLASKALLGKRAEVEVASLELGDQIVAEWTPIIGITYDYKDDLLDIALDGANHLIQRPRQVAVEESSTGLLSVAVTDAEGTKQIIRMKDPLMLPPSEVQT